MSQILGVKFNDYGQVYYFSSGPFVVREAQEVIVKTDQGMGLGRVVLVRQAELSENGEEDEGHKPIYRLANEQDLETLAENDKLSREAYGCCRKCIQERKLDMKLVDVEVFFDRSKMVFYFTAPGRIDFRELIKDLVREYRTRIELRQIGVRHETQMIGALGNCGQICCCRRFMRKFVPVTIKMAKEQNLFLNPTKISGICGRLLCCLSFEQQGYEEFHKLCPKIGRRYQTKLGMAKVFRSNFFKKTLTLSLDNGEEKEVAIEEWHEIVNMMPDGEAEPGDKVQVVAKASAPKPEREAKEAREAREDGSKPKGPPPSSERSPGRPVDGNNGRSDVDREMTAQVDDIPERLQDDNSKQADKTFKPAPKGRRPRRRRRKPKSQK